MTTSIAENVKKTSTKTVDRYTYDSAFAELLAVQVARTTTVTFPSPKYREDPVAFFREVLGVEPWSKQIEIIEAVLNHKRVSVRSGHKVSKSHTSAGLALWFYCSFVDARVVMTSTTDRQVNDILWLEVKKMRARSGICVECKKLNEELREHEQIKAPCEHSAIIDGKIGELARTGLTSEDFREIKGFTAREAEAMAGTSGANLLYIVDEASGVKQEIFDAIEGNRAGGARIALFSNPTKTSGEFYDSHNSKAAFYCALKVSSEDTPNVQFGEDDARAIPGLAGPEWVEEKEEEWGRDSAQFKVRVLGEFAELEEGKIFSIHMIAEAEELYKGMPLDMNARPYIGLDVAGEGPLADEIVWAPRRGKKLLDFVAKRSLSKEAILMHTIGMCNDPDFSAAREVPVVVMDREGKEGAEVYGHFMAYVATTDDPAFELVGVRASDKAHRTPHVYDRMRDELAGVLFDWLRQGGAIPEDSKFAAELHMFEWIQRIDGRIKITPKKEIKRELKRSPDRYDAAVLSVWEPLSLRKNTPRRKETIEARHDIAVGMDPYAGVDQWTGGG